MTDSKLQLLYSVSQDKVTTVIYYLFYNQERVGLGEMVG